MAERREACVERGDVAEQDEEVRLGGAGEKAAIETVPVTCLMPVLLTGSCAIAGRACGRRW
ncbi:hypothetical protein [Sphingomonas daechungensis]|uniref:hypothetical protein n=1 Tax=Sphingomonas daechungensis TaxID=1176646 RepID=UPI00294FF3A3|nr:hypothetical protein [Sphingomonas daechungensis]